MEEMLNEIKRTNSFIEFYIDELIENMIILADTYLKKAQALAQELIYEEAEGIRILRKDVSCNKRCDMGELCLIKRAEKFKEFYIVYICNITIPSIYMCKPLRGVLVDFYIINKKKKCLEEKIKNLSENGKRKFIEFLDFVTDVMQMLKIC